VIQAKKERIFDRYLAQRLGCGSEIASAASASVWCRLEPVRSAVENAAYYFRRTTRDRVPVSGRGDHVLGGGPNRMARGSNSITAACTPPAIRERYESIMVTQPETVSTDTIPRQLYLTPDRRRVLSIYEKETEGVCAVRARPLNIAREFLRPGADPGTSRTPSTWLRTGPLPKICRISHPMPDSAWPAATRAARSRRASATPHVRLYVSAPGMEVGTTTRAERYLNAA